MSGLNPDEWDWSGFEFVDTHLHIWSLSDPRLHYSYLMPGFVHPQLGDLSELRRDYTVEDLQLDFGRVNTTKAIHVQAAFGIADPYDETLFVQEAMDANGFPTAMVANVNLRDQRVEEHLERHLAHPVRGIRDQQEGDYLDDPSYLEGCRRLARLGLHLEVEHMGDLSPVARLAAQIPDLRLVLDHAGRPVDLTPETHAAWLIQLRSVASQPNTWCKISGLGMADPHWTSDRLDPFIMTCIEEFGPSRCFFGTNWPVDSMYSTYQELIAAYRLTASRLSADEAQGLFTTNAEQFYRI